MTPQMPDKPPESGPLDHPLARAAEEDKLEGLFVIHPETEGDLRQGLAEVAEAVRPYLGRVAVEMTITVGEDAEEFAEGVPAPSPPP